MAFCRTVAWSNQSAINQTRLITIQRKGFLFLEQQTCHSQDLIGKSFKALYMFICSDLYMMGMYAFVDIT